MPTDLNIRCGECNDPDSFFVEAIEVSFAIPAEVTQEQSRRLVELVDDITSSPWNQPQQGVHWLSGMGSKPHWSRADSAFLGQPAEPGAPDAGEPTFDDSVYFLKTCAREFLSEEERERKERHRAKPRLTEDELRRLIDQASVVISQLCGRDYWGKSEECRQRALGWLKEHDLLPSPLRSSAHSATGVAEEGRG